MCHADGRHVAIITLTAIRPAYVCDFFAYGGFSTSHAVDFIKPYQPFPDEKKTKQIQKKRSENLPDKESHILAKNRYSFVVRARIQAKQYSRIPNGSHLMQKARQTRKHFICLYLGRN